MIVTVSFADEMNKEWPSASQQVLLMEPGCQRPQQLRGQTVPQTALTF